MADLILFITNKCNLRCFYCPVEKKKQSMSLTVVKKSIDFYLQKSGKKKHLRFFGGEPFLEFAIVKAAIEYAKQQAKKNRKKITFDLTTNGTLLDNKKLDFIRKNKELELIISLDGRESDQLKNRKDVNNKINSWRIMRRILPNLLKLENLTINMVIAPNQVDNFYNNFIFLVKSGFKNFNFLPAYYIYWPKKSLKILSRQFKRIVKMILILNRKTDFLIKVKNMDLMSDTPLFNQGLIVGYNGDIYANNLIFSRFFSSLKDKFRIGNINNPEKAQKANSSNHLGIIKKYLDKKLYQSTLAVDRILSEFVGELARLKAVQK